MDVRARNRRPLCFPVLSSRGGHDKLIGLGVSPINGEVDKSVPDADRSNSDKLIIYFNHKLNDFYRELSKTTVHL